jgi:hypothetical protein
MCARKEKEREILYEPKTNIFLRVEADVSVVLENAASPVCDKGQAAISCKKPQTTA